MKLALIDVTCATMNGYNLSSNCHAGKLERFSGAFTVEQSAFFLQAQSCFRFEENSYISLIYRDLGFVFSV